MGLHGGGYTFLHPKALAVLEDADIQDIFTDKVSLLMRIRKSDGTQPFAVLSQLSQNSLVPLTIGLNNNSNFPDPVNKAVIPGPYLFFGFLPRNIANQKGSVQGMNVSNVANTFTNCDGNPNSHIALFPNFKEITPSAYLSGVSWPFCDAIFSGHQLNPSRRVMPDEYFMFGELHFGGCGCFSYPDRHPGVLSTAIGFRWKFEIQNFCWDGCKLRNIGLIIFWSTLYSITFLF